MNSTCLPTSDNHMIEVGNYPVNGVDLTETLSGNLIPLYNKRKPDYMSAIRQDIQQMEEQMSSEDQGEAEGFPAEVFPTVLQRLISECHKHLSFPIDYIGASMLFAISVAIGNTFAVKVKRGWIEKAVLYLILIGKPNVNKTHPLNFALAPIQQRDREDFQAFKRDKGEYDTIVSMSAKQRDGEDIKLPDKPRLRQRLISDYTPESIASILEYNPRGIGVHMDEFAGWIKGMDRYHKGNEMEFWLSNWNNGDIKVNRKTVDPVHISNPFISVAGTIQNGILHKLKEDNRSENGFLMRMLFVMPDHLFKPYLSEEDINTELVDEWFDIMTRTLDIPIVLDDNMNVQPSILPFEKEAKIVFFDWHRTHTDRINNAGSELIEGVMGKFDMYTPRFALILEVLSCICRGVTPKTIGVDSVLNAVKLTNYFINNALRVHSYISNINPLDSLNDTHRQFYDALPSVFTKKEASGVAEDLNIAPRTCDRILSNRKYFNHVRQGEYKKRIQ